MKRSLVFVFICFSVFKNAVAQSEWKTWDAVGLTVAASKKLSYKFSVMSSMVMTDGFKNDFNQFNLQQDWEMNKRFSLRVGAIYSDFGSGDYSTRGYLRVSHRFNPIKSLTWTNGIQVEHFEFSDSATAKYDERIILNSRLSPRKKLKLGKLRITPALSYALYYNIGGDSIRYYNPNGRYGNIYKYDRNVPNGFHRGRIMLNLSSKIAKNLFLSVYYMNQQEFNFLTSEQHRINVPKYDGSVIFRPFDDYHVLGLTMNYEIKAYKKKPASKSKNKKTT